MIDGQVTFRLDPDLKATIRELVALGVILLGVLAITVAKAGTSK